MATVGPTSIPAFFNSDADFRLWGSTISAALASIGLIQTADTGQINWTTVTKPAAINTSAGYEIWRFNDSLQASVPVFIKVEYATAAAVDRPAHFITVGQGSNGSGTLTGTTNTRTQVMPSTSKAAGVTLPMYVSGNAGELFVAYNVDISSAAFGCMWGVERPKDGNDNPTNEGAIYFAAGASSPASWQTIFIPATGSISSTNTTQMCAPSPSYWSKSSAGAAAEASPVFIPLTGAWRYSHFLVTGPGDFTAGGTMTATIFGASHTYMAFDNKIASGGQQANGQNCGIAFRWE